MVTYIGLSRTSLVSGLLAIDANAEVGYFSVNRRVFREFFVKRGISRITRFDFSSWPAIS